jgi:hypothetical protein
VLNFDLGAELLAQTLESRRDAESAMLDRCTVGIPGAVETDPDTGQTTPSLTAVYPDPAWPDDHPWKHGPCKVQTYEAQESNPDVGGSTRTVQRYAVHLPVGSFAPQVGAVIQLHTAAIDPNLAGRVYRVVALLHKTMATAYRLGVEEADARRAGEPA